MATFYSPKGRRNSYKTAYAPKRAHKVQLKVSTFNWIVVLELTDDEKIDIVAARILKRFKPAFEELAK